MICGCRVMIPPPPFVSSAVERPAAASEPGVSQPWPVPSACPRRQSKGSTRTDGGDDNCNTVRPEPVEGPLSTANCPSTSSGRTEDYKPLFFRSFGSISPPDRSETAGGRFTRNWVGVVAMRMHRSRQRKVPTEMNGKRRDRAWPRETTPTPPLKRRGLKIPFVVENTLESPAAASGPNASRPWPVLSACPSRQSKDSTRTDGLLIMLLMQSTIENTGSL